MTQQRFEQKVSQTTCPYCGVGCGVDVTTLNGQAIAVAGTKQHPANFGKLCIKGSNLADTVSTDDRLLIPEAYGQQVTWPEATNAIAQKFNQLITEHGPDSIAFYVSGQILTEDYYIANKLIKGFIGTANIDTNSRLCMSSAVAGYKRAFGSDTVPCSYDDLEHTDLLVLVGSNAAWTHPILFQRMEQAKKRDPNLKFVVVDPKKTATAEIADVFLQIKAGSDVALFCGLLQYLVEQQQIDQAYIEGHCQNWQDTANSVEQWDIATTATYCDVNEDDLTRFYQLFSTTQKAITFYSQGVNQSSQGVDKCNAIINCHLATGKIGKQGSGPFSITGQPNAMGGREVGGLANMLAAHMNIEDPQHRETVQTFWQSPTICTQSGAKAVDLFEQIEQGKIKALWVMATNPMVSMPNRNQIERALSKCELIVVSDCVADNDTLRFADIKLPATTWAEKNGTVTNSERRISRQRGIIDAPGQAKHDWQIISEVAQAMGFNHGFNYQHPSEIFAEHAALSGFNNNTNGHAKRDFDISAFANISQQEYDKFKPIQWPVNADFPNGCKQMFADGKFFTPSGKANFVVVSPKAPKSLPNKEFPFVLNSGRVRDQWHTMTRTGKSGALSQHTKEPFLSINSEDADKLKLQRHDLAEVYSEFGKVTLPITIDDGVKTGNLFAPIHWNQTTCPSANIAKCFGSYVDPISGQPESKFARVNVRKQPTAQYIQIFSKQSLTPSVKYWSKVKTHEALEYLCQDSQTITSPIDWAKSQTSLTGKWSYFANTAKELTTVICLHQGQLAFVAFFAANKLNINSDWLDTLMSKPELSPADISQLLQGQVPIEFSQGKIICSCFKVGENQIIEAITEHGNTSVEQLGERLKCGTNCGSCKTELSKLVKQQAPNKHQTQQRIDVVEIQ